MSSANLRYLRDTTLLVICLYSLIVSLCMLYVLRTHSSVVNTGANQRHAAQTRPNHPGNTKQRRVEISIRSAGFINGNQREMGTTAEPDRIVTANATEKPASYLGYSLLDKGVPLHLHCKSCSLVSSSGQLLNSGAGTDIDSADCVLRMNSAPVAGWEEDVGMRTDVRVIGHVNLQKGLMTNDDLQKEVLAEPATRTKIVIVPWLYHEKVNQSNNSVFRTARNFSMMYPDVKFYFLTEEKMIHTEERFGIETGVTLKDAKTWLSTGFVAMLFALDVCDRIDVYGLANLEYCRRHPNSTLPYHYYEPDMRRECDYYRKSETRLTSGHKFMTEKAVFARWSVFYNIHFHYPSWQATIKNVTAALETPFLQRYKEALKNGSFEKVAKAAPKVRIIRRVKVIRKRKRKPNPQQNETQIVNKDVVKSNEKNSTSNSTNKIVFPVKKKN